MNLADTKRIDFLNARRKRFRNLRFIIPVAGLYILYDGIRTVINEGTAPTFFYVFLVVFAGLMIFAFFLNEKRLRVAEAELAQLEALEASEASVDQVEYSPDDFPEDPDPS